MNREKLIEEMMVKYGYSRPVPPEIRRRITDRKAQVFRKSSAAAGVTPPPSPPWPQSSSL